MIYRIIQKRHIFLSLSAVLIIVAIFALIAWGLNFGVDFRGGSLLEAQFSGQELSVSEIRTSLEVLKKLTKKLIKQF